MSDEDREAWLKGKLAGKEMPPPGDEREALIEKLRARLVAESIPHLEKALALLNDADAMCKDRVYYTLENVKYNYNAFWGPKEGKK